MNSFDEIKKITLSDERTIELQDTEEQITLAITDNGNKFHCILDFPDEGYGGGAIYTSPSNQYLLFLYYSGQSEEAFRVFKMDPTFTLVYNSGYQFGEAADYSFSEDDRWLVQCLPNTCVEWWDLAKDWKEDKNRENYFHYGVIRVLNLTTMELTEHPICVDLPDDWQPNNDDYDPMMAPKLNNNNSLEIQMPWGKNTIPFPLDEEVILRP